MTTYRKISDKFEVLINDYDQELWDKIPEEQLRAVFGQGMCDLSHDFLGFTETYFHLAKIIPKHFTVIDLGAAFNPQCFYFTEHKKFIAVDRSLENEEPTIRFKAENCEIFDMDIKDFLDKHLGDFNLEETFAIINFVPPWGQDNMELVRKSFKNVFTYYPHGGHQSMVELKNRQKQ